MGWFVPLRSALDRLVMPAKPEPRPPIYTRSRTPPGSLGITGCCWGAEPDREPWATGYGYFAAWCDAGIFTQLSGLLHHLVRTAEGRQAEPRGEFCEGLRWCRSVVLMSTPIPITSVS